MRSVLFTPLASLGQLALPSSITIHCHSATPSNKSSSSGPELLLQCAHCDAHVPLVDFERRKRSSSTNCIAEFLDSILVTRHSQQCKGRFGGELLRADDVHISVDEGHVRSNAIEALSGMDYTKSVPYCTKFKFSYILPCCAIFSAKLTAQKFQVLLYMIL